MLTREREETEKLKSGYRTARSLRTLLTLASITAKAIKFKSCLELASEMVQLSNGATTGSIAIYISSQHWRLSGWLSPRISSDFSLRSTQPMCALRFRISSSTSAFSARSWWCFSPFLLSCSSRRSLISISRWFAPSLSICTSMGSTCSSRNLSQVAAMMFSKPGSSRSRTTRFR